MFSCFQFKIFSCTFSIDQFQLVIFRWLFSIDNFQLIIYWLIIFSWSFLTYNFQLTIFRDFLMTVLTEEWTGRKWRRCLTRSRHRFYSYYIFWKKDFLSKWCSYSGQQHILCVKSEKQIYGFKSVFGIFSDASQFNLETSPSLWKCAPDLMFLKLFFFHINFKTNVSIIVK